MEGLAYIILAIATLLSLYNILAIRSLKKRIEDAKDTFQSQLSWSKEDLRNDLSGVRTVMKVLAAGGRVTNDMVDDGKPFSDMSASDAVQFLASNPETVVIDVRTSSEFQSGHIPGAKLIPVDEVETRINEIPKDAKHLLVTCQGGTRSAVACQVLSEKGYMNLINMYDGMGSWPGKKEIGVSIRPPASANRNG